MPLASSNAACDESTGPVMDSGHDSSNSMNINSSWDCIWAEAYETVKEDPDYARLLTDFEKELQGEQNKTFNDTEGPSNLAEADQGAERLRTIQKLTETRLDNMENARLSFSIGKRHVFVRKAVLKAIEIITTFKPIINRAISAEPHAALAWGGIMAILPMLENSSQHDEDAANGLNDIICLLVRYQSIQENIVGAELQEPGQVHSTQQLPSHTRDKLVNLYSQVYKYEIRFVLQYGRKKAQRALRIMLIADGWKILSADIQSTSKSIDQGWQDRVAARSLETWKRLEEVSEGLEKMGLVHETVQKTQEALSISALPCALNAVFDSADISRTESPCLEGTQNKVLSNIQEWAESPDGKAIYWLQGMAGTGKTSVALTVAKALSNGEPFSPGGRPVQTAFLAASFFFEQGDATRNSTKTFYPTIARSLAHSFPDIKPHLVEAIEKNLGIESKGLQPQMEHLLVGPLSTLDQQTFLPIRLIVVVDALDECLVAKEAEELLGTLSALQALHQVQLRLLVTSRPERHIHRGFGKLEQDLYHSTVIDKVQPSEEGGTENDISIYLRHAIARIAEENVVEKDGISDVDISRLSQKSDGLFIYAATLCRFLDTEDFFYQSARETRLRQIFDDVGEADTPQQKIDEIYLKVLSFPEFSKSPIKARIMETTGRILGSIAVLMVPVSVASLCRLLQLPRSELDESLERLHSVVDVPQDEKTPLSLVHASFRDFILDPERSKLLDFRLVESEMHQQVLERCLEIMSQGLRQDMCGLILPGKARSEVPWSQVKEHISGDLRYACRYWVEHLAKLEQGCCKELRLTEGSRVHAFLQKNFLFWIEAMVLMRETPSMLPMINRLYDLVDYSDNPTLSALVYDAKRLVLANRWAIDHAPLQIYCSALLLSPLNSSIRSNFKDLIPDWISKVPVVENDWTAELYVLDVQQDIASISFSPTDKLIASGCLDGTTKLWDYETMTERFEFDDPSPCCSVAFSCDGKMVASGLYNGTTCVREFTTGAMTELITPEAKSRVESLAFSPTDSNILAVASDYSLRIWNVQERRVLATHGGIYSSFVFSPDGSFILGRTYVDSYDETSNSLIVISMENAELARRILKIKCAGSISISRDCRTVALEVHVKVQIWDIITEKQLDYKYDSHMLFNTVRFSPASEKLFAVNSGDGIIQIRHAETSELMWQTRGPASSGGCFGWSQDGRLLAAAGRDKIHVWDVTRHASLDPHPPKAWTSLVHFLPGNGNGVLSDYGDMYDVHGTTLWDLSDGSGQSGPLSSVTDSRQLVFSPDGTILVSPSESHELPIYDGLQWKVFPEIASNSKIIFSPDSKHLALTSTRYVARSPIDMFEIRIIDTTTWQDTTKLTVNGDLNYFAFSPNGKLEALIWKSDPEHSLGLKLWDRIKQVKLLDDVPKVMANRITFSANSRFVAYWGDRWYMKDFIKYPDDEWSIEAEFVLYDSKTSRMDQLPFLKHIEDVAFHPRGHLAAIALAEKQVVVLGTACKDIKFRVDYGQFNLSLIGSELNISSAGKMAVVCRGIDAEMRKSVVLLWDINSGIEIGNYVTEACISGTRFSKDLGYLESSIGRLPLPYNQHDTPSESDQEATRNCLYVDNQWICQGFERLIWLPPAYRPSALAVREHMIGLGMEDAAAVHIGNVARRLKVRGCA
ncbi:hypothetical protein FZEAL_8854 [Fusarium zealandicum]|uniref:NACHT domain-containing protein n=1 Tax=Fusarium zealandicum TaxID=1053134 RepID=A0A8H4UDG9_9HYPO|nr:hypothetical protein FZEAL_8854 [Fusarium zealandicum]